MILLFSSIFSLLTMCLHGPYLNTNHFRQGNPGVRRVGLPVPYMELIQCSASNQLKHFPFFDIGYFKQVNEITNWCYLEAWFIVFKP